MDKHEKYGSDELKEIFNAATPDKNSPELLRIVAENIGSSISVLLLEGEKLSLLYANDTFFKWVGTEREHYNEDTLQYNMTFVAQTDRPATLEAVRNSAITGEPQELEYQFLRPGEPPRWLHRRLAAMELDEPDSYLLTSVVTDVTEQKNAELQRAAECERTQSVMDNMPCGLVKVRMEKDGRTRPLLVNKTFLTMTDMSMDEMMELYGNDSCAGVHPDDLAGVKEKMKDFCPGENRTATFRLRKGKRGWVWMRVTSFIKEENGVMMLYNSYLDISNELENGFMKNSLLNVMPGGVAVLRLADTIECLYFNDGYAALSDRSSRELEDVIHIAGNMEKIIFPADMPYVLREIETHKTADEPINTTFRFLTKNGEVKWIHMSASKLRDDDGFPVYYCIFTEPSRQAMLYRGIADGASVGIMVSDAETHEIYYINRTFRELMHLSDEKPYVGRKCYEFLLHKSCPCGECVIRDKVPGPMNEVVRHFPEIGTDIKVRSTLINWLGRTALVEYAADVTAECRKQFEQDELLNRVPAGIGIYEISGGILYQTYMNDGYYRLINADRNIRDKRRNENCLLHVHPEDVNIITDIVKAVIDGQNEFSLLHRVLCGDGSYRWFRLDGTVINREAEKIVTYCAYTDSEETEQSRVRLENAHISLKNKYAQELAQRKALEKDSAVILEFNITKDKLISYQALDDRFYTHASGISSTEMITNLLKRVPDADDRRKSELFFDPKRAQKALTEGIPMNIAEYRCRQKDGLLHWIKAISNVETDPETNDLISYTYLKDIDSEKKCAVATNSVIDEETDYVLLVSTIADLCMIVWVRENYMIGNRIIQPLQNLPFSSSAQYVRLNTVVPEDRASVEFLMDKSAIMRELEAANRAKSDFLSRISHDMRTPLNGILGTVYLAQDKNDTAELKKI